VKINGVQVEDTFAEAFKMYGTRILITAKTMEWARESAIKMTGFATSVIGCGCEAGIEGETLETPDRRPGVKSLVFTMSKKEMEKQLLNRVGQCVMTSPTSACFNGLETQEKLKVGGKLRFFGDGFQISKLVDGKRYWRIPVMDGEFLVEDAFGFQESVGGGNFLVLGEDLEVTLRATEKAVNAIKSLNNIILPFPGGIVRSGSKLGSRYKNLGASTNTAFCPTIKRQVNTSLSEQVNAVLEIVIDGLDEHSVKDAMKAGIEAACIPGIAMISAGNYGGSLGQSNIYLHQLF